MYALSHTPHPLTTHHITHKNSQSILRHVNMLIGQEKVEELEKSPLYRHRKATLSNDEKGASLSLHE
jgi:hypothetical protein